jgi:hypothetical protein
MTLMFLFSILPIIFVIKQLIGGSQDVPTAGMAKQQQESADAVNYNEDYDSDGSTPVNKKNNF